MGEDEYEVGLGPQLGAWGIGGKNNGIGGGGSWRAAGRPIGVPWQQSYLDEGAGQMEMAGDKGRRRMGRGWVLVPRNIRMGVVHWRTDRR